MSKAQSADRNRAATTGRAVRPGRRRSALEGAACVLLMSLVAVLVPWRADAGTQHLVFVPEDGSPSTTNDDLARVIPLTRDYDGADNSFWLVRLDPTGMTPPEVFLPTLNDNNVSGLQVLRAVENALDVWNGAKYSNFRFEPSVGWADMRPLPFLQPFDTGFRQVAIDGINLITFSDPSAFPDDTLIAVTITTYFQRDFRLTDLVGSFEIPFQLIAADQSTAGLPAVIVFDLDQDGNFDIAIPFRDFERGQIIETDITVNPNAIPYLHVWPDSPGDVPPEQQNQVLGSLDVQAVLMHELGWAQGLGNSLINRSVMYPFYEPVTAPFPTDPYERRKLSLDDEITAGIAHGGDFGGNTATIAGAVIEGSTFNVGADVINEVEGDVDAYVVQAPVLLGVRVSASTDPEQIEPDEIIAVPAVADENQGTYRMIAHVMTGQNLEIGASVGGGADVDTIFQNIANPNPPLDDPDAQPGGSGVAAPTIPLLGRVDSNFVMPGVPALDDSGQPRKYALFITNTLTAGLVSGPVDFLNPVQSYFNGNLAETFPDEFYGGPLVNVTTGDGSATDRNLTDDSFFENNYITAEIDPAGRIAASINPNPVLLSGFNRGPRSYIDITSINGRFTNRFGPIGLVDTPLIINDVPNTARAAWLRPGNLRLEMRLRITDQAGVVGIPAGIQVDYTLRNESTTDKTFTFRQVLDTFLWTTENPVYRVNDVVVERARSYVGAEVPREIVYQSSRSTPIFKGFIDVRSTSLLPPDRVTIGPLNALDSTIAPGSGPVIVGPDARTVDTGVSLTWIDVPIAAGESKTFSFVVGFLPSGKLVDTAVPLPAGATAAGVEDDPMRIQTLTLQPGEYKDDVFILTNTGAAAAAGPTVPEGSAAGLSQFVAVRDGFPPSDAVAGQVALGDIDNDGDLDCVVGNQGGGNDFHANTINRVYLNEIRVFGDGSTSRYFRDVTYGDDGLPGTADDRLPIQAEVTTGVHLADLDGDGYLDIVFSGPTAPLRVLRNRGEAQPGFFDDVSAEVLPGFLNLPWSATDATTFGNNYRVTSGDIDSDGDLDLIVSMFGGSSDFALSQAWIDSDQTNTDDELNAGRMDMQNDLFSGVLVFTERVLINHINEPVYAQTLYAQTFKRGFYFTEETLGSDDRFGTMTSLVIERDGTVYDLQTIVSYDPTQLDRMPPVFPPLVNLTEQQTLGDAFDSPQAAVAVEPILGHFTSNLSLGLLSVRPFAGAGATWIPIPATTTDLPDDDTLPDNLAFITIGQATPSGTLPGFGLQNGYFTNVDIWSNTTGLMEPDGIPDGYFYEISFGNDFGGTLLPETGGSVSTAGGLFVIEPDPVTPVVAPNTDHFRYDANPLFIAIPEGFPGDAGAPETDGVTEPARGAWAGTIADWENHGTPRPLLAAFTGAFFNFGSGGFSRAITGGVASAYNRVNTSPYAGDSIGGSVDQMAFTAVPFNVHSADLDNDGDPDVIATYITVEGFVDANGNVNVNGTPSTNRVFLNDSFNGFTELTGALLPNNPGVTTASSIGDIDNDGDVDLVVFKAEETPTLYLNQLYRNPPDLADPVDPTLYYEATASVVPPVGRVGFQPGEQLGAFSGIGTRAVAADFNMDGRPEVAINQGGRLTNIGDYPLLYLNTGLPGGMGIPIFRPAGAPFPAPAVNAWDHGIDPLFQATLHGAIGFQRFGMDVLAGDFDSDGDPDLFLLNNASQPLLLINEDTDLLAFNTAPDTNSLGDGIFFISGGMPLITDPGVPADAPLILKLAGRAAAAADVNRDGRLDIVIANGLDSGGAPNVLLINEGSGFFSDRTETNLPLTPNASYGIRDNTTAVAVADVTYDGYPDIVFANTSNASAPAGFRLLVNRGDGTFFDADPITTDNANPLADAGRLLPQFRGRRPVKIVVADFDGLGEPNEDVNGNGFLDPGEDKNNNGVIDWIDLPSETEDANGNGLLDPGEDVGIIGPDGTLVGAGNGVIDRYDRNNDGVYTYYRNGVLEGSYDLFITCEDGSIILLLSDPTQTTPGRLVDQTTLRFPSAVGDYPLGGCTVGDIDLDGLPDIVAAEHVGGVARPVRMWLNGLRVLGGKVQKGFFRDVSYEIPFARAVRFTQDDALPLGPQPDGFSGYATDVALLDVDGDGDLDMFVLTGGRENVFASVGSPDLFFINRIIGDGWNFRTKGMNRTPGNPIVHAVNPQGAPRNAVVQISLAGENFTPETTFSFGSGITVLARQFINSNRMDVTLSIAPDAALGPRSIFVQGPGGTTQTKFGIFTVYAEGLILHRQAQIPDRRWALYE